MTGAALLLALLAGSAGAAAGAQAPAEETCPAPYITTPRYPADLARSNRSGSVLIAARIDDCGRVLETRIETSSGFELFDRAAKDAVATYVLSASQRAKARDGWIMVPLRFGGITTHTELPAIPWPDSHRRPRYLPDEQAIPFDDIAGFEAAEPQDDVLLKQPYFPMRLKDGSHVRISVQPDKVEPQVFWLLYVVQPPMPTSATAPVGHSTTAAVARYRLVQEDGVPVARVGMLCELDEEACGRVSKFLFEGLPFAKPRRR